MKRLSGSLRSHVRVVEASLGAVIAEAEGRKLYETVERVRRLMVRFRSGGEKAKRAALKAADRELAKLPPGKRAAFAKAYPGK